MMNRYDSSYGRGDFNTSGDFGLFGSYGAASMGPPPSAVPAPFSTGPPPSLMSLAPAPSLLPPPNVQGPLSLGAPPSMVPPPLHSASSIPPMGTGVAAGSAGMSMAGVNTNSKHPMAMKARVFVGNLNTNAVSRDEFEQLYRRFGEVLAVSMHRGYGFVQYQYEREARSAISFTDGMTLGGQKLDVNLASEPKTGRDSKGIKRQADTSVSEPSGKRTRPSDGKTTSTPKPLFASKSATGSANVELTSGNKTVVKPSPIKTTTPSTTKPATSTVTVPIKKTEPLAKAPATTITPKAATVSTKTEINGSDTGAKPCVLAPDASENSADILICGRCRSLFGTLNSFTEHRKENGGICNVSTGNTSGKDSSDNKSTKPKADDEPEKLPCGFCQKTYDKAWDLVQHAAKDHNITIYQPVNKEAATSNEKAGNATDEKSLTEASSASKASMKNEDEGKKN